MSDKIHLVDDESEDEHFSVHSNDGDDTENLDTSTTKILQPSDPQVQIKLIFFKGLSIDVN